MNSSVVKTERAIFAAGCFWGVEHSFQQAKGVVSTTVGFIGGNTENPSYQEVCKGQTAHAEAVEIVFDPAETSYEALAKMFFQIHNPTLISRERNGKRSQYRSAIFYSSGKQKLIAEYLTQLLRNKNIEVATEITQAGVFYKAEDYHQSYYSKKGKVDSGYRYTERF